MRIVAKDVIFSAFVSTLKCLMTMNGEGGSVQSDINFEAMDSEYWTK